MQSAQLRPCRQAARVQVGFFVIEKHLLTEWHDSLYQWKSAICSSQFSPLICPVPCPVSSHSPALWPSCSLITSILVQLFVQSNCLCSPIVCMFTWILVLKITLVWLTVHDVPAAQPPFQTLPFPSNSVSLSPYLLFPVSPGSIYCPCSCTTIAAVPVTLPSSYKYCFCSCPSSVSCPLSSQPPL